MKKYLLILQLSMVSLILFYCGKHEKSINQKPVTVYKIENPGTDFFQWDGLVDHTEFIKLDSSKSSLMGHITQGIVDNNKIYLLDFFNQSLLSFDHQGKFLRKIGQKGKGPQEFLEVRDFCISNDTIYTLDYEKIHSYNRQSGDYIESWAINSENGFNPENFVVYSKDDYYLWSSNPDGMDATKGDYFRLRKIKQGKIDSAYFKYDYEISGDPRFYGCGNNAYYLKPIDGESAIYQLNKDSLFVDFAIDFGDQAIPTKDIQDLRNSDVPNAYLKSNYFKNISNVLETRNYIYFQCVGPESKSYEGLISKKTGEIKFGRWDYKHSPRIFYSDGTTLYGYYQPYAVIKNLDKSSSNTCFSSVLNKMKDLKVDDNLILVKVHLKE